MYYLQGLAPISRANGRHPRLTRPLWPRLQGLVGVVSADQRRSVALAAFAAHGADGLDLRVLDGSAGVAGVACHRLDALVFMPPYPAKLVAFAVIALRLGLAAFAPGGLEFDRDAALTEIERWDRSRRRPHPAGSTCALGPFVTGPDAHFTRAVALRLRAVPLRVLPPTPFD